MSALICDQSRALMLCEVVVESGELTAAELTWAAVEAGKRPAKSVPSISAIRRP